MRTPLVLLAAALAALVVAAPAQASPALALTQGNVLLGFDTASPGTITRSLGVFGLGQNETLRGIDVRLADGQLYGITVEPGSGANSVVRTYRIDQQTGKATFVGASVALAGAGDIPTAFALNPLVDRFRYMNINDENARFNPNDGALSGNDTDLEPAATTSVIGAAYDRSVSGASATTLYAIDQNTSTLSVVGSPDGSPQSPNAGVVTDVGALGFTLHPSNDAGFDIVGDSVARAALTSAADNLTRLYAVNLATGAADAVGPIGDGSVEVRSLAILPDPIPAPCPGSCTPQPPAPILVPDREAPLVLVALDRLPRLSGLLRSGARLRFMCSEACTATGTLRSGRTLLSSGRGTVARAGIGTLRFTRSTGARARAIRRLRRSRRARVTFALTVVDAAGNRRTQRRTLTLLR
jgi:Domain of unknown function (DUF4394)